MHELGLAEDALRKVKEEAKAKGLATVSFIKFQIGETLISDLEEFKELFSMISTGTLAEGAKVEIEILPLKGNCAKCGKEINLKVFRLDCPHCGSTNFEITSGKELKVEIPFSHF
ncbi:MAG: hydrogenase maturation nickel metallochaperone HypA [Candidatus Margulisiibacteriota bacterium]